MDNLERSTALKRDASDLLAHTGIDMLLRRYGEITYVGSYALGLMAWPDIDVSMVVAEGQSISRFMELCAAIAEITSVTHINYRNFFEEQPDGFPRGLYAGVRLRRGIRWKIDVWSVARDVVAEHQREMASILERLDDDSRAAIINAKFDLLTAEGRTPIGSGHRIYEAVLWKGLRKTADVRDHLRNEGVEGI